MDFFIHGVPKGHQVSSKEADPYIDNLYSKGPNIATPVQLIVKCQVTGGKRYSYYSYLVNGIPNVEKTGVNDIDGRAGSYFGMTVRFEAQFVKDILNIYRMFDCIFHSLILGNILEVNGTRLKYKVMSFAEAEPVVDLAVRTFSEMMQEAYNSGNSGTDSLDSYKNFAGAVYQCNNLECTDRQLDEICKLYGGVEISPYFPSKALAELKMALDQERLETNQKVENAIASEKAQADSKIQALDKQISIYRTQLSKSTEELELTKKSLSEFKSRKDNVQKLKTINEIALRLEPSVSELASLLSDVTPPAKKPDTAIGKRPDKTPSKPKISLRKVLPLVNSALLLLILIFVIPFKSCNSDKTPATAEIKGQEIAEETPTEAPPGLPEPNIGSSEWAASLKEGNNRWETETYPNAKLDIEAHTPPLSREQSYTIRAKNYGNNPSSQISWTASGIVEDLSNEASDTVRITPVDSVVIITLNIDHNPIVTRKIPVKQ